MKEPQRFKLNPETPTNKDVPRIPLPSVYKPEWDLGEDNNDIYIPLKENLGKDNENNSENNSESVSKLESDSVD